MPNLERLLLSGVSGFLGGSAAGIVGILVGFTHICANPSKNPWPQAPGPQAVVRTRTLQLLFLLLIVGAPFVKADDSKLIRLQSNMSSNPRPAIVDSRYGFIPAFNMALSEAVDACPASDLALGARIRLAPSRINAVTTQALGVLGSCRPDLNAAGIDAISLSLYKAVTGATSEPSVFQRIKILVFKESPLTPDYDRTFWDIDTTGKHRSADPASIFTWGPFRATAGHGHTLQKVLRRLQADEDTRESLQTSFSEDPAFLSELTKPPVGGGAKALAGETRRITELFRKMSQDPARRQRVELAFANLANSADVRRVYDDYFYGQSGVRAASITRYITAWENAGLSVSGIDFGFFVERSLQYPTLSIADVGKLTEMLKATPNLTNLTARQAASRAFNFKGPNPRNYQTGRDAIYFVSDNGLAEMTPYEKAAWDSHSGLLATDVGLSDSPYDYCSDIAVAGCARAEAAK